MVDKLKKLIKKGDTIIEVTFAISVLSLISVITIQVMDRDLASIQGAIESEMARNEIDAQAEALRFIQNAYLSERELAVKEREFMTLWLKLSRGTTEAVGEAGQGLANIPTKVSKYTSVDCKEFYEKSGTSYTDTHKIFNDNAFVINTRKISPTNSSMSASAVSTAINDTIIQSKVGASERRNIFAEATLYPRIIYTKGTAASATTDEATLAEVFPDASMPTYLAQNEAVYDKVARAEGIWVIAVRDYRENSIDKVPEYYDFHIRTCWFAPGHNRPSTIATTIRLYNPEYIEDQQ
ncbi:hypothetical protein J6W91_01205 [Candidatus Saccharibacteria bacterium]|nr:hypothetical protein [Candidatus Saccharibacteria bacterium]